MTQLLQNAAYGAVLILAVVLLRQVLKDRLLPGARLALWAVCLFRLLTPAAPESMLSLWGLSRLFQRLEPPSPAPYVMTGYVPAAGAPAPTPQTSPSISWETVLLALWIAVGVVLAARYVLSWKRTRRAVSCAIPLDRSDERYSPLPRCARLREGPMEGAPLTFGAVRPTVVLSPGLVGAELDCVLAHEGVHARRRDNLWHYVMALALAVHWWNPAVWLMSRLLRRDIELSCDRAAVRRLGEDRRAEYAQALVTLATQADGPAFCHTFGRKAAEERILSIMKFKKTSIIGVLFSLTLVLAVTAAFASEPKEPDEYDSVKGHTSVELLGKTLEDHIVTVPDIEATKEIQSDLPEVDPDEVDLSKIKESLAKKVADGEITQEEADQRLAATEEMLERARRGEEKIVMTEDGNSASADGAIVGKADYVLETDPDAVTEYDVPMLQMKLDEYKAHLDRLVKEAKMAQADADDMYASAKRDLEKSEWSVLYTTETGSYAVMSAPLCDLADCKDYEPHKHGVAKYSGHVTFPCPLENCQNGGSHYHDGVCYLGTLPICVSGCAISGVHAHDDGVTYKSWTGKLPAPAASEAPVPVCSVDGCTIGGNHIHNGVTYACSGFHSGNHSSGHHGNGHH